MSIMTRFVRLCKADIHGVIDQFEEKNLLLKQCLREMEEELGRKEARLKQMGAFREQTQRERKKYTQECDKLEDDLTVAIEKEKDDIARMLIKKLKPLGVHRDELVRHIEILDEEIVRFRDCVEKQRLQYEQFQLRSREYFQKAEHEKWEGTMSGIIQDDISREPSEEEIELELLRRKETIIGGTKK